MINPTPAIGGDPSFKFYETNNVTVTLANGSQTVAAFDNGLNRLHNQAVKGPWITSMKASLYKTFPIKERASLRRARTMQFALRLSW